MTGAFRNMVQLMLRYKKLILIFIIVFLAGSMSKSLLGYFVNGINEKACDLNISNSWNLSGSQIFINNTDPNYSWSKLEVENDWCSGSGTWNDPYKIENVTIVESNTQNCIEIINSIVPFIIKNCFLENPGAGEWVYGILLNNVSNSSIINNTCNLNYGSGIRIKDSTNNTISNNILSYNEIVGIVIEGSSNNNTVFGNQISNNNMGISTGGNSNKIINNYIVNTSSAVAIQIMGLNHTLSANIMEGCGIHIRAFDSYAYMGIYNEISTHSIATSNLVNNKPVHYRVNQEFLNNEDITNPGQVLLVNCSHTFLSNTNLSNTYNGIYIFGGTNNTILNSTLQNNANEAVYLHFTNNNTISGNKIKNSSYGIKFTSSHSNNLASNEILFCHEGIFIEYSDYNNITGCFSNANYFGVSIEHSMVNKIEDCTFNHNKFTGVNIPYSTEADNNIIRRNLIQFNGDYGLYIMYEESVNNVIYFNFFIDNGVDAYDYGTNTQWDNGSIGNYWYDYTGVDNNDDGIGDTPYNFGTGIDYFPIYRERPNIVVHLLKAGANYKNPPNFTIEVTGSDIDTIWYMLNLEANQFVITNNGTIDLAAWNDLPNGNVIIRFYVNDTVGIYSYQEVIVRKNISDFTFIIIISIISIITIISITIIIVWKLKFSGKTIFIKDPEKMKLVKRKLLDLGTQFDHLRISEIAESCGVLERSVISILKEMIKNNEIYAKYYKTESLVEFDQQLITQEIDQLMEIYREWEEREFGKSK